jgi:hypothetical protein
MQSSLCLMLRCCIRARSNEMKCTHTSLLQPEWGYDLISYAFEVPANIITESSCASENATETQAQTFYNFLHSVLSRWLMYLCTPTVRSWWSQQGEMAASQWHSWWVWWFDTLDWHWWLSLHSFLLCLSWFGQNQHNGYLQSILVEFLCNLIDIFHIYTVNVLLGT